MRQTTVEPLHLRLVWQDPLTGERYERISQLPVLIGRAASINTIVLNDRQVSRQHALLNIIDGQIVIIDQDSTNGTLVDGQRIKLAPLATGSTFQIGPFEIKALPWLAAPHTKRM
jgi:pSer/pThr/pTyr-binding forkhead associated (FHA) protein